AQPDRTPLQPVQMLRLAARRLADLRFARFPQPQSANPRHRTPAAIGQLQLHQRFALAPTLHRPTHAQLPRTRPNQRHLPPPDPPGRRTPGPPPPPQPPRATSGGSDANPPPPPDPASAPGRTPRPFPTHQTRHASRSPWNDGP